MADADEIGAGGIGSDGRGCAAAEQRIVAGIEHRTAAVYFEVGGENRLGRDTRERGCDFLLLLWRRGADIQHVHFDLRLGRGAGVLRRAEKCFCKDGDDHENSSEHSEIVSAGEERGGAVHRYNCGMANLTLVYGLRLLPSEEVAEVEDATLKLKNGREAHVTMHVLEGSKDEIEKQLKSSLDAFFDFYPEI
jgi:hypothetical protein